MATAAVSVHHYGEVCRHCGETCVGEVVHGADGPFCCSGCAAVFAVIKEHDLDSFYACELPPGVTQKSASPQATERFAALDDPTIAARLLDYADGNRARVTLTIPGIHCGACVWLLEQLWRLDAGVASSEVDLGRRSIRVEFDPAVTSLRGIAELLARVGYEPSLVNETAPQDRSATRRLYQQLGVAGFAFGNIMLFSIPRYANGAAIDGGLQRVFDVLNVTFAIPVLLFSAADYFRSAWQSLRTRTMTLDVPVALGLLVLFGRSIVDIAIGGGEGFLDSFSGLVFFLLIGRLLQQKVFEQISFERTFRSFLPLSVRVERQGTIALEPIERLCVGDSLIVRHHEVLPADAELLDESGAVDYAFITGEQAPVVVRRGDTIRAGGRAAAGAMRLRVIADVSHTRLASLWDNPVFARQRTSWLENLGATFGAWFTLAALLLAAMGALAWWPDVRASLSVATAVLIVACPCALTLAAPITLGTAMAELGQRGLYLKRPSVALDLSRIDTVVFDKTGTLTATDRAEAVEADGLSPQSWLRAQRLAAVSSHPASRVLADLRFPYCGPTVVPLPPISVREVAGHGVRGIVDGHVVAIGTPAFVAAETGSSRVPADDRIHVAVGTERGSYRMRAPLRPGVEDAIRDLGDDYGLWLLSGDHGGDASRWASLFHLCTLFRQSPEQKLEAVKRAERLGQHVLMIGDGLNDAGAFAAASAGIAVSDDTMCLAPACDAVIAGHRLPLLPAFLRYARSARHVVVLSFVVSVLYNAVGLTLALSGALTPLAAAILMPVSSLTVIGISAGAMRWLAWRSFAA
jgi:Cu+-exporting ATPase